MIALVQGNVSITTHCLEKLRECAATQRDSANLSVVVGPGMQVWTVPLVQEMQWLASHFEALCVSRYAIPHCIR